MFLPKTPEFCQKKAYMGSSACKFFLNAENIFVPTMQFVSHYNF